MTRNSKKIQGPTPVPQAGSKAERTPARPPSRARPRPPPPLIAASSLPEQRGGCLGSDRLVTPAAGEGDSGPTAFSSYRAAEGGAPRLGYAGITADRSRGLWVWRVD